jgi:hypothetical protein
MSGVEPVYISQNGAGQHYRVNPGSIRIDVRAGAEFGSCYGVNLAVSGFRGWLVFCKL